MCEEADAIKADLRACKTPAEIHEVSDRHRERVRALYADKKTRVHALHIANLKQYRLDQLRTEQD